MRIKITNYAGVFANSDGRLVNPAVGSEVDVGRSMGRALIDAGSAEEVKPKRAAKAKTGPGETR